jgi:hypothetical protein
MLSDLLQTELHGLSYLRGISSGCVQIWRGCCCIFFVDSSNWDDNSLGCHVCGCLFTSACFRYKDCSVVSLSTLDLEFYPIPGVQIVSLGGTGGAAAYDVVSFGGVA